MGGKEIAKERERERARRVWRETRGKREIVSEK